MKIALLIDTPVMTQELFAEKTGVSKDTIRGMIATNALPTRKLGKRRFINVAKLTSDCLQDASSSPNDE